MPATMADEINWTRVLQLANLVGVAHLAGKDTRDASDTRQSQTKPPSSPRLGLG